MARFILAVIFALTLGGPGKTAPQEQESRRTSTTARGEQQSVTDQAKPASQEEKAKEKEPPEEKPVVTHHEIRVQGKLLKYTATAGMMPIKNADGETEAHIFYMAYTLDNSSEGGRRPLMFSFNGGPGSSSVWLHLGAIGPKRVKMLAWGGMPAPPFQLVDNDTTWLDQTDLCFIDPVGTGYSRPTKKELGKKFWSVPGDIESVGEFIRLYLTRNERWTSPLFLVGESYGTTRAAGLSGYLVDHGIALNGVVLVSTVLNFETLQFTKGNDLPYILYLPSYTTTAWYHKKLPQALQSQEVGKTLAEVEQWASTEYAQALAKGDALTPEERAAVAERMARYTGLSKNYVDNANLRVHAGEFRKELLRDEKRTVGRLDSRFKGIDASGVTESPEYDPSEAAIRPPYTSTFNNYVRTELAYKSDLEYYILGGGFREWEWGSAAQGFPNVSDALRRAFVKNPYMRLFVASGHYDLATPFFATQYTLNHLSLDPTLERNITTGEYEAGHMVYIDNDSLAKLKRDIAAFLAAAMR